MKTHRAKLRFLEGSPHYTQDGRVLISRRLDCRVEAICYCEKSLLCWAEGSEGQGAAQNEPPTLPRQTTVP